MRKYSGLLLLLSFYLGAVGFGLRRMELATAFEPLTGLARRGAQATLYLGGLTVLVSVFVIIFAVFISRKYRAPEGFKDTFGTDSVIFPLSYLPVWILWICGTVIHLLHLLSFGALQTIDIYFVSLSALAAISTTFFAIEMFQNSHHKSLYALSLVPIFFLCFWLIFLYRQNAANPVLLSYVYQCLAIVFSALCFYYTSGFLYGKPAPGRAILSYFCTVYFCGIMLADNLGIGLSMIVCAILATGAIQLCLLLRNLIRVEIKVAQEEPEPAGWHEIPEIPEHPEQ